jgi:hypothetical protein
MEGGVAHFWKMRWLILEDGEASFGRRGSSF